jgi:phospholipase/carboxylesterase
MKQSDLKPYTVFENPLLFRIYPSLQSEEEKSQKFLLLHGWTGNEFSMSIFISALPENSFAVSPRGPYQIDEDNYGWMDISAYPSPNYSDFIEIADLLYDKLHSVSKSLTVEHQKAWNVIGFSQGAALSAVLAVRFPHAFRKVCLLSGFLPKNPPNEVLALSHLEVFISHGIHDQLVPFDQALKTKNYFLQAGASVVFCEEEQSHKIGSACSVNLKRFLNPNLSTLQE